VRLTATYKHRSVVQLRYPVTDDAASCNSRSVLLSVKWPCSARRWLLRGLWMAPSIRILVPHRRPLSGQPRSSQGTFLAWFAVTSAGRPGDRSERRRSVSRQSSAFCVSRRPGRLAVDAHPWHSLDSTRQHLLHCETPDNRLPRAGHGVAETENDRGNCLIPHRPVKSAVPRKGCGSQPTLSVRETPVRRP